MSKVTLSPQSNTCSITIIQQEAHCLVQKGCISRRQPIYTLCQFISAREWPEVEEELEKHGYLLRDPIVDLLPREIWVED